MIQEKSYNLASLYSQGTTRSRGKERAKVEQGYAGPVKYWLIV